MRAQRSHPLRKGFSFPPSSGRVPGRINLRSEERLIDKAQFPRCGSAVASAEHEVIGFCRADASCNDKNAGVWTPSHVWWPPRRLAGGVRAVVFVADGTALVSSVSGNVRRLSAGGEATSWAGCSNLGELGERVRGQVESAGLW